MSELWNEYREEEEQSHIRTMEGGRRNSHTSAMWREGDSTAMFPQYGGREKEQPHFCNGESMIKNRLLLPYRSRRREEEQPHLCNVEGGIKNSHTSAKGREGETTATVLTYRERGRRNSHTSAK